MTLENNSEIETVNTPSIVTTPEIENAKVNDNSSNSSNNITQAGTNDSINDNMNDNANNNTNDKANDTTNGDNSNNNDTTTATPTITTPSAPPAPKEQADGEDPIYISSDESMEEQSMSEDSDMDDSFDDSDQDDTQEEFNNELMIFYLEEIMRYNGKLGDAIENTQNTLMEDMRGLRQFYEYIKRTLRTVKRFPVMEDGQRVQAIKSNPSM